MIADEPGPTPRVRRRDTLLNLSAALATRRPDAIRSALDSAAGHAAAHEVDEVILQSHLFLGFPDALNALALWREISGIVAPAAPIERDDPIGWAKRGERLCAATYGPNYARLRANVSALHPDLDRWMVIGGYGRVLGRPGLDLASRELCIVALLAVWNVPRQLHSHLRGALNAGASPTEVDQALEIASRFLAAPERHRVQALWSEIRRSHNAATADRMGAAAHKAGPDLH